MWFSGIGFDTDGIIVNADPLHFKAFNMTLKEKGIKEIEEEEYKLRYIAFDDKNFFKEYLKNIKGSYPSNEEINKIVERKSIIYKKIEAKEPPKFYEGIISSIKEIAKYRNVILFDVSGSLREEVVGHLKRGRIYKYFKVIVTSEDTEESKPSPEPYLKVLEKLKKISQIEASKCIVAEDSPDGVLSAKKAGFKVIGVTNTTEAKNLWESGADIVVKKLTPQLYRDILKLESYPTSKLNLLDYLFYDEELLPNEIDVGDYQHIYINKSEWDLLKTLRSKYIKIKNIDSCFASISSSKSDVFVVLKKDDKDSRFEIYRMEKELIKKYPEIDFNPRVTAVACNITYPENLIRVI